MEDEESMDTSPNKLGKQKLLKKRRKKINDAEDQAFAGQVTTKLVKANEKLLQKNPPVCRFSIDYTNDANAQNRVAQSSLKISYSRDHCNCQGKKLISLEKGYTPRMKVILNIVDSQHCPVQFPAGPFSKNQELEANSDRNSISSLSESFQLTEQYEPLLSETNQKIAANQHVILAKRKSLQSRVEEEAKDSRNSKTSSGSGRGGPKEEQSALKGEISLLLQEINNLKTRLLEKTLDQERDQKLIEEIAIHEIKLAQSQKHLQQKIASLEKEKSEGLAENEKLRSEISTVKEDNQKSSQEISRLKAKLAEKEKNQCESFLEKNYDFIISSYSAFQVPANKQSLPNSQNFTPDQSTIIEYIQKEKFHQQSAKKLPLRGGGDPQQSSRPLAQKRAQKSFENKQIELFQKYERENQAAQQA